MFIAAALRRAYGKPVDLASHSLRYRDADSDLVTLVNDDDLRLALAASTSSTASR